MATEIDYTAICLIEHVTVAEKLDDIDETISLKHEYHLRHLERLPLNTGYNEIIEAVKLRMDHPDLRDNCILAVDRTGVGNPVMTMLRNEGLSPIGVYLTGGSQTSQSIQGYNVPKIDIVSALSILLQSGRLHASPDLLFQDEFKEELKNFRAKKTPSGQESFSAWRESIHDDLVLSVSIACYVMMKTFGETPYHRPLNRESDNVFSSIGV